ncbi:MAG TPA: heme lyase CcmF/NrfE family subunit, partial [Bacteroidetes bacterium]|nr:heme lyase CcmF/NrfE family subunit [Bacteroidota bacterium]
AGLVTAIALFLSGIRSLYPLMSFSLSAFVFVTIVLEFYRGAVARARISGRNILNALWDLTMRNKRRYGGYIVHLGVIMIFVGITGSSAFQKEIFATVKPGETIELDGYVMHYKGLVDQSSEHAQQIAARIDVQKNGREIGTLYPAKMLHKKHDPVSEVAIRQTLKEDLYLILTNWDETQQASIKALVNPLVAWIWIGGTVMIIGSLIALGPDRLSRKAAVVQEKVVEQRSQEVGYAL